MTPKPADFDSSPGTGAFSSESAKTELIKLETYDLEIIVRNSVGYSPISSDDEESEILNAETIKSANPETADYDVIHDPPLLTETIKTETVRRKRPGKDCRLRQRKRLLAFALAREEPPPVPETIPVPATVKSANLESIDHVVIRDPPLLTETIKTQPVRKKRPGKDSRLRRRRRLLAFRVGIENLGHVWQELSFRGFVTYIFDLI